MRQDKLIRVALLMVALSAIGGLAVITVFIFNAGLPIIGKVGLWNFISSSEWYPAEGKFGIFPMIIGSLAVTLGAMVIAVTLSLGCAIVLTQFCPPRVVSVLKPSIELLAGIPSVVYGFIGVVILVPFIRDSVGPWFHSMGLVSDPGPGLSVLASSIVLGIMALPTITSISVDALQAVPRSFREGSLAMGATTWQTTHMVMLKAARSGIVAAIILGMGRAIGETMAVIMVAGNTLHPPGSIFDPVRTLTSNIALEMGYAQGDHRQALFATGVVLFVVIMILNTIAMAVSRSKSRKAA
jgi:phosphate ABC transporter permease protein PstC